MREAAQATDETKRSFKNGVLGLTWVETGEAPDWQRLYERREPWQIGTVPSGGLFLTAGADVQKDRIEVDVWAWGRGLESWLVDHIVIDGGPEKSESWNALHRLLSQTWPHAYGAHLGLAKLAIDTGYESAVYAWARRAGHAQVRPIKGVGLRLQRQGDRPGKVNAAGAGRKPPARCWMGSRTAARAGTYRSCRVQGDGGNRRRQRPGAWRSERAANLEWPGAATSASDW